MLERLVDDLLVKLRNAGKEHLAGAMREEVDRCLRVNWTDGARFLCVVSDGSVDMVRIGVHPKLNEFARVLIASAMRSAPDGFHLFLLSSSGVRAVDGAGAERAIVRMEFATRESCVLRADGSTLACFEVQPRWESGCCAGSVLFSTSAADGACPSVLERLALRHIATCLIVESWQSLFAAPSEVLLDGQPVVAAGRECPEPAAA